MESGGEQTGFRAATRGRWQIPLLCAGLALLGAGLGRSVLNHRDRTFEEELVLVERMRQAKHHPRASAFLLALLDDDERPVSQRVRLHRELAKTTHAAESQVDQHAAGNAQSILANVQAVRALGERPNADDWIRAGDAHLWLDQPESAARAYQMALDAGPGRPDSVRRRLVELAMDDGADLSRDAVDELERILSDEGASVVNRLWALDAAVRWLLDHDEAGDALAKVETTREVLADRDVEGALDYLNAFCLARLDRADEAEVVLRSLRNRHPRRDEVWAQSGWLLGRLQQLDDRPQAAVSFYDAVLRIFDDGDIHDACLLAKAESLAALAKHDRALETFAVLRDRVRGRRRHPYVDPDAVRATLTLLGDSLKNSDDAAPERAWTRTETGVRYHRLALESLGPRAEARWSPGLLSRIAEGLERLAETAPDSGESADADRRRRLWVEAGKAFEELARAREDDSEASGLAAWRAIGCFSAADDRNRAIALLKRFAAERPSSELRPVALRRLGQLYQSEHRPKEAAGAYETLIGEFARLPDALASIVPLARCLIALRGDEARRGVDMLLDVVDGRDDQALGPQSNEYREALVELARYYAAALPAELPDQAERAIERLETALALYPDDARAAELTFLLADSYRRSAVALRAAAKADGAPPPTTADTKLWRDRIRAALEYYGDVIAALAPHDERPSGGVGPTGLERTYLRVSYLYRGDCLFDLGLFTAAVAAYEEAAWRYDNTPTAISATLQTFHCYQRMGRSETARSTLGRLGWLIETVPETQFDTDNGMPSKAYWVSLIKRLNRMEGGA